MPIATSPGRSGFGPQLSLSYDSGAGNGPFGFGWSLSLPSITRKTDKGLPQYLDAEESDVFILSGAEDLVPVSAGRDGLDRSIGLPSSLDRDPWRSVIHEDDRRLPRPTATARASRGCSRASSAGRKIGDAAMSTGARSPRTTSSPSTARTTNSRIADPPMPSRIFSWLICESTTTRATPSLRLQGGGRRQASISAQAARAQPRDRDDARRTANRYLKRIRYGNRAPLLGAQGSARVS